LREFHVDSGFESGIIIANFPNLHYPVPKNQSADFISGDQTIADLTTFDADVLVNLFLQTCLSLHLVRGIHKTSSHSFHSHE